MCVGWENTAIKNDFGYVWLKLFLPINSEGWLITHHQFSVVACKKQFKVLLYYESKLRKAPHHTQSRIIAWANRTFHRGPLKMKGHIYINIFSYFISTY